MRPKTLRVGVAAVAALVVAGLAVTRWAGGGTVGASQPSPFDHKAHMETSKCSHCHRFYETRSAAGMPRNADCLGCHEDPMTKKPEEARVRKEFWDAGKEMAWVRMNRLTGNVHFSHAAHVKYGKMDCKECHGDMAQASEPVSTSQIERLDMGRCMACHIERRVGHDCFTCHK